MKFVPGARACEGEYEEPVYGKISIRDLLSPTAAEKLDRFVALTSIEANFCLFDTETCRPRWIVELRLSVCGATLRLRKLPRLQHLLYGIELAIRRALRLMTRRDDKQYRKQGCG